MKRTQAWVVLPVFLGVLGGVLAWARVRNDDPTMARWMLVIGIAVTVISSLLVIYVGILIENFFPVDGIVDHFFVSLEEQLVQDTQR